MFRLTPEDPFKIRVYGGQIISGICLRFIPQWTSAYLTKLPP